ncbi:MAG TPA: hypothetical protein VJ890_23395 [Vineibacter sp.]|nr:hypothetical protein [Vineibacter sp.]
MTANQTKDDPPLWRTLTSKTMQWRNPLHQLAILQRVEFHWSALLSSSECRVLMYILHRTVTFGEITKDFTIEGIMKGGTTTAGTGLHRDTVSDALRGLKTRGVIKTKRTGKGLRITVNIDWIVPAKAGDVVPQIRIEVQNEQRDTWDKALARYYPDMKPGPASSYAYSSKDVEALVRLAARWPADDFASFLSWCVESWKHLAPEGAMHPARQACRS